MEHHDNLETGSMETRQPIMALSMHSGLKKIEPIPPWSKRCVCRKCGRSSISLLGGSVGGYEIVQEGFVNLTEMHS